MLCRLEQEGWPRMMYGVSKTLESAWSRILAQRLKHQGIDVNACCPGRLLGKRLVPSVMITEASTSKHMRMCTAPYTSLHAHARTPLVRAWSCILAQRLAPQGVAVNACCPGTLLLLLLLLLTHTRANACLRTRDYAAAVLLAPAQGRLPLHCVQLSFVCPAAPAS